MKETIYNLFKRQVSAQPDAIAVMDKQRKLTFKELDELANTISGMFPIETPKRVGIMMNHNVEMIASLFAVLKNGAAYIPVEPSFPPERIKYIMEEARVDFIITHGIYSDWANSLPTVLVEQGLRATSYPVLSSKSESHSLAYILYTLPGVNIKLRISPLSLIIRCGLNPKNHPIEHLPRSASPSKVL